MSKKDFYQLLNVSKTASKDEIKKAYRKNAMKYHPDRNPNDKEAEAQFRSMTEAYEVLSDEQKRAAYDRYGHAAFDQNASMGGGFGGFHQSGGDFNANSIFEEMLRGFGGFGGGGGGHSGFNSAPEKLRGSDIRYDLEVTLEQAFEGISEKIKFVTNDVCDTCNGSGGSKNSKTIKCKTCNGHGAVHFQQGIFTMERTCQTCEGLGKTISDPCVPCHGQGRSRKQKNLEIKIPAGVDNGTRIRMTGEGEAGLRGGGKGDLYVYITVKPHKFFRRSEKDLYCSVPISMVTAAIGGSVDLPAIDGKAVALTIPEGTQSGTQLRLRHKGMSAIKSAYRGDLIVEVKVETPVHLNQKQKDLLTQFKELEKGNSNSPQSSGFFTKVKNFFDDIKGTS